MSDRQAYRIVVTGPGIASEAKEILAARGCAVAYVQGEGMDGLAGLADHVRDHRADGIIVRKGTVDRAVLTASERLRAVCKHGVGVDNIDVRAAAEMGIVVLNTPAANFESVAEHSVALMFALARRLPTQDARVREGRWDKRDYRGEELAGKTLGLVGFGRVGQRVAGIVAPLRMNTLVYDPWADRAAPSGEVTFVDELNELLPRADVVSLHCPLTPETRGMIGSDQLRRMPEESWLINTARGAIVHEGALIEALHERRIAGAALDTFEAEPPDPGNPLLSMENVILTNHIAGISTRSFTNMGVQAVENLLTVLDGETPDPSVVVSPA